MLAQVLLWWVGIWASVAGLDEKTLAAAQLKFAQAAAAGTAAEKAEALEALVGLGEPGAVTTLALEYGNAAEALRAGREEALALRYACERREVVLAGMRAQAERDPATKPMLQREEERFTALKKDRAKADAKVGELAPWRDAVADGLGRLVEALGPARRRKSDAELWADVREHVDTLQRAAAAELVGRIGAAGTAGQLYDVMCETAVGIDKLRARIAKSMGDVRKLEKRWQEEAAANEGRVAQATADQYAQAKREASELVSQGHRMEILVEAAQRAAALALAREGGKELEKTMAKMVGTLKRAKDRTRIDTLQLLTLCSTDAVKEQVRGLLAAETEPLAIGTLIDGLAALGDTAIEPALIGRHLAHESWYVRARAARALAELRSRAAIPALIARLEKEDGRSRTDVNEALRSLTGQRFKPVVEVWQRWWKDNEAAFVVPPRTEKTPLEDAQESAGVTFFGISTDSQRVLFVLDLSGSMQFSMVPKNNPNDEPGMAPDMPAQGELSRLEAAKRDLSKAVGGLRDGGVFNLVLFASDVWTWADELVTMTPQMRKEASDFIAASDAVGATNIYGSLERALDLAGAKGGASWSAPVIDTIYFLTDGRATVGLTTNTEEILSYVRERNRNSGIVIHTIGLSDAHDAVLMRRLAEENGGTYVGR